MIVCLVLFCRALKQSKLSKEKLEYRKELIDK